MSIVITSYSIHYTKLYEFARFDDPAELAAVHLPYPQPMAAGVLQDDPGEEDLDHGRGHRLAREMPLVAGQVGSQTEGLGDRTIVRRGERGAGAGPQLCW